MTRLLYLFMFVGVLGCQDDSAVEEYPTPHLQKSANSTSAYLPSQATLAAAAAWRHRAEQALHGMSPCSPENLSASCKPVEVRSVPWQFEMDGADAPKIMILEPGRDCSMLKRKSLGRYRSRIAARFSIGNDGEYSECRTSMVVPSGLASLLDWEDNERPFLPAKGIDAEITKKLVSVFPVTQKNAVHGDPILSVLAEYNPDKKFVLAEPPVFHTDLFCNGTEEQLRTFARNAINSLRGIILLANVKFINESGGLASFHQLENDLEKVCGEPSPRRRYDRARLLERVSRQFYTSLSSIHGVLFVQAAASLTDADDRLQHPSDCQTDGMPNRVRAGFVDIPTARIPPEGEDFNGLVAQGVLDASPASACTDIYVNSGLGDWAPGDDEFFLAPGDRPVEITSFLGMSAMPLPFFATSYAAPVALSALIHFAEANNIPATEAYAAMTNGGYKNVVDPVRHGQLSSYAKQLAWGWPDEVR